MLKPDEDEEPKGELFFLSGFCDCGAMLDTGLFNPETGSLLAKCDAGCETLIQNFRLSKK